MSAVPGAAHRVARGALEWLAANRERGTLPWDGVQETSGERYKALGEVALTASLALREAVATDAELRTARELADFAWEQVRGGDLLYERTLRNSLITDGLETYGSFVRAGYRHPRFERLLRHLSSLGALRATELLPNRRLAVANAARVVGVDDGADWPRLLARTWLGALPEPWAIDWHTGYHVTHTVFHTTDWGARPEALPPPVAEYLADWLPVWADIWRESAQWDLLGELLIVGSCLERPWSDERAWACLAAAQHGDGLVPRDAEPVDADADVRFADHQHPTLVAAIAGYLTLGRLR